ncbi:MAG: chromosomal replication initiator protein DnaA [Clostridiales bacterium]|nr:chromosomal replication initiator protein DnaA [Clostridiales bacterium]
MPYTEDLLKIWQRVIENFGDSMPRATIENMFYDIVVESFDGSVAVLSIHSEYRHSLIVKKYLEKIRSLISEQLGKQISLVFKYSGSSKYYIDQLKLEYNLPGGEPAVRIDPPKAYSGENKEEHTRPVSTLPPCNQEYTFSNFIVGNSNKFAHAACVAVAERPATDYNPLFIYGQSGLGKTHLLYAITNELIKKKPDINIIYTKSEDFTNYLVECLKDRAMDRFRQKFRSCDVLLIDDIQFIAGKDSTQEEFFHTFNALYEEHKQIILTSDRPPSDIKTLEYRLKTRFEWGLIADIQPPEFELRLAIIKKKSEQAGINIPDDVCEFLAENLRTNIRQIEGSIKKLRALSFLTGTDITMEMARGCVAELLGGAEPVSVTVDKIFAAVYKKYGIPKEDILGSRRTKEIAFARHVTSYLIRNITEMSLPNIGKLLGRDHSTIISSIDTIEKKLRTDKIFNIEIEQMIKEVNGH